MGKRARNFGHLCSGSGSKKFGVPDFPDYDAKENKRDLLNDKLVFFYFNLLNFLIMAANVGAANVGPQMSCRK